MKRYLLAAMLVLIPVASAAAADIPDEQREIIDTTDWNLTLTQAELFDDLDAWSLNPSEMQMSYEDALKANKVNNLLCTSTKDPNCKDALGLHVRAYLPTCITKLEQYCVEEFFAIKDGVRIDGTYKQQYPEGFVKGYFDAEPEYEIPAGGAASLWSLPGITNSGGTNLFLVNAQLFGGLTRASTNESFGRMGYNDIWSSINAVSEISAPGARPNGASNFGGGDGLSHAAVQPGSKCLATATDKCLISWPLDESMSLGMTIKLPRSLAGWLHGRFNNPDMKIVKTADGATHVTFIGSPMKVPTVFARIPWSQASEAMKARFGAVPSGSFGGGHGVSSMENAGRYQSSEQMVDDLNLWLPIIKDKASATPTYWMVRTIVSPGGNQSCFKSDVVNGVVTTNATAYTSGAPIFNRETQSLDYRVASPHYDAKGGVNIGHYNLQINSAVARCLYGFTSAPISATVSIISADGSNQVAVTSLQEKNGWIYLSASGFTYSSPMLRVQLTQKKEVVTPTPTPTPSPTVSSKKITITCVKGTSTKRVTALKPLCPKGYRIR